MERDKAPIFGFGPTSCCSGGTSDVGFVYDEDVPPVRPRPTRSAWFVLAVFILLCAATAGLACC